MPDRSGAASPRRRPPPAAILAASKLLRRGAIALVRGYQLALSPYLGSNCRFFPSCSQYAIDALHTKPLWKALGLIVWRIARCQPLCKGGFDLVPEEPEDAWYRLAPRAPEPPAPGKD